MSNLQADKIISDWRNRAIRIAELEGPNADVSKKHSAGAIAEILLESLGVQLSRRLKFLSVLHWFDRRVFDIAVGSIETSSQSLSNRLFAYPFIEHTIDGYTFNDLTRQGLISSISEQEIDEIKELTFKIAELHKNQGEGKRNILEAFYCYILADKHKEASRILSDYLTTSYSNTDWQSVLEIFKIKEEAERFFWSETLSLESNDWMIYVIALSKDKGKKIDLGVYEAFLKGDPELITAYFNRSFQDIKEGKISKAIKEIDEIFSRLSNERIPDKAFRMPSWKRLFDVIGSPLMLLLLSPLLFLTASYIYMISPGPVLFTQERIGLKGKSFKYYKFRTMRLDNPSRAKRRTISNEAVMNRLDSIDPRIIPCGRFIRSSAIDELPQLFNILKGDMSFVGPRPPIPYEAELYLKWHRERFRVRPGLTGLWQVSGKNSLTFKEMIQLDIEYASRMSFWLDLKILILTPITVIRLMISSIESRNEYRREINRESHEATLKD